MFNAQIIHGRAIVMTVVIQLYAQPENTSIREEFALNVKTSMFNQRTKSHAPLNFAQQTK